MLSVGGLWYYRRQTSVFTGYTTEMVMGCDVGYLTTFLLQGLIVSNEMEQQSRTVSI